MLKCFKLLSLITLLYILIVLGSSSVNAQTTCSTPYPMKTYYISPTGSDSNTGIDQSHPIATFNHAWELLCPGDTLYVMDGTYYQSIIPNVRNGAPNPAINQNDYLTYPLDHPDRIKNYIKIKALNDGQAIIDGQYTRIPVQLGHWEQSGIGQYFIIEGIVAKNSSENVYNILAHNVIIRHTSGFNSNTHDNTGVYEIWGSGSDQDPFNILLEDNFASGIGRKMFMAYSAYVNVIFRRNTAYIKEVVLADNACQNDWPNGDGIEIYNWNQQDLPNNSLVENNLFLGGGPTYGFSLTPNPARTIGNQYLGNISLQNGMNLDGTYRVWSCSAMAPVCQSNGTKCAANGSTDWLYHRTGFTFGIYANPYFKNNTFQDLFAYGNASFGLTAGGDWCDGTEPVGTYPCARCNSVENNPYENCTLGQLTASDRSSGNILNRMTLAHNSLASASPYNASGVEHPPEALQTFRDYGTLGTLYIEGNTLYADKSKGARLRYRYVNGVLMDGTNGQPAQELWPWPMEDRIRIELAREFGIQNYSVTNTIVPLINQYTAQQVPLGSGSPTPSVTPSPNPADVNGSGGVDFNDLKLVLSNWLGLSSCATFICDLNSDSKINAMDASLVIANWGK